MPVGVVGSMEGLTTVVGMLGVGGILGSRRLRFQKPA
jgi:hypothetical protein